MKFKETISLDIIMWSVLGKQNVLYKLKTFITRKIFHYLKFLKAFAEVAAQV